MDAIPTPSAPEVTLRPAEPADADACAQIVFEAFGGLQDLQRFQRDVPELEAALTGMDPTFVRARASLHADLAAAHRAAGEREAANEHACEAERLGLATQSARQRRRVQLLLDAERE